MCVLNSEVVISEVRMATVVYSLQVPHTTFCLTHVCFLLYHMTSNLTLRRLRHFTADLSQTVRVGIEAGWIFSLSYFIAYLETVAISNVIMCSDKSVCLKFLHSLPFQIFFINLQGSRSGYGGHGEDNTSTPRQNNQFTDLYKKNHFRNGII